MKIRLQHGSTETPPGTDEAVFEKVHFALARLSHRIRMLSIRLDDLNGPRGGVDTRCVMEAALSNHGRLVVDVSDEAVLSAVSRAARRMARRVADEFERARDLRRHGSADIPTAPKGN